MTTSDLSLDEKIVKQLEYYFGNFNLSKDKFLIEKVKEDDGWVTLEVLLTFKRLAGLSSDPEVIAKAVESSKQNLVVLSEDRKKLRRNPKEPVPEVNEEVKKERITRTAYAKGFPLEETMDLIEGFLQPFGPTETVVKRTTKDRKFKGSCFILFKDVETCTKFVELESVKYKDTELIRKMQADYLQAKKQEIEERKKAKQEKKQATVEAKARPDKQPSYPKGASLFFSGIPKGQSLTREEIKEKFAEIDDNATIAFIDFNKGDVEGHLRFNGENTAVDFHKKLDDSSVKIGEITLDIKLLQGDEEDEYLKKSAEAVVKLRQKQRQSGKQNRKRKGNFQYSGKDRKSRKND